MAWLSVGNVTAGDDWRTVGEAQSPLLRVRYSFQGAIPQRVIFGVLRERFDANLYNSRWYNLYPKTGIAEIILLQEIPNFFPARDIEVRKRGKHNFAWSVQIDQWY
ncbi:MAG: hypothetical protein AAF609_08525 [Cyanobacteria bacterium P01_C01_bin.120]